jgi:fructose-1,6-bisphosphatase I
MNSDVSTGSRQVSLNQHLFAHAKAPDTLRHLILDIARAAKYIQFALRTTDAGLAGSRNAFGEEQVKLDVLSDKIIRDHLMESRLVSALASEEQSEILEFDSRAPYSVVYDPLDGSSLVDVNFAIGSIFGIFPGNGIVGRTPAEQLAALYVLYGPRTVLVYGAGNGVHAFLLNDVGEFVLLREHLGIADSSKSYAPGNIQASCDTPGYRAVIDDWIASKPTLRYSGCLVADVHHMLSKGQGVFANIGGAKYPNGKLRLAFECGPLGYLVELAGGASSDGSVSILKKTIATIDQRTPLIIGSSRDVSAAVSLLAS